jgi:hypothetical protein
MTWMRAGRRCGVLFFDGEAVGVTHKDWRRQIVVTFTHGGRDYRFSGLDAIRDTRWALLVLTEKGLPRPVPIWRSPVVEVQS